MIQDILNRLVKNGICLDYCEEIAKKYSIKLPKSGIFLASDSFTAIHNTPKNSFSWIINMEIVGITNEYDYIVKILSNRGYKLSTYNQVKNRLTNSIVYGKYLRMSISKMKQALKGKNYEGIYCWNI